MTSEENNRLAQENAAQKETIASLQAALQASMQKQSYMEEMFAKFSTEQEARLTKFSSEQADTNRNMLQQITFLTTKLTQYESNAGSYRTRTDSNASWNEPPHAPQATPVEKTDPKLDFCKLNVLVTIPIQQLRTFNGPFFIDVVNKAIAAKLSDPNTTSFKENLGPENVTLVQRVESRSDAKATFRVRLSEERLKYTIFWIKAILRNWPDLAWIISEELTPLQKQAQQQKWSTLPTELRSKGVVAWFQGLDLWCRLPTQPNTRVQILSQDEARRIIEDITVAQAAHPCQRPASPSSADPSPAAKRPHATASETTHNPDTHLPDPANTHMPTSPTHHAHMIE